MLALLGLVAVALGTPWSPRAAAQSPACAFVLGFATLRDLIGPGAVGDCVEDQRFAANGNAEQRTTGGLMVWRKADNWTAFTDGYQTWLNGPSGLQRRLNTDRFDWEGPDPPPAPAPPAPPAAAPAGATGLEWATQVVLNSPYGDIAVQLRNRAVQIGFGEIPAVGAWIPAQNRIVVSSQYQAASAEALAAVLVHEGTHAQDFFRGLGFATPQDCFDRELHAFNNQAQFWRTLYGPEGKPGPADDLERQMNAILRVTSDRPTNFLEDLLVLYRHSCGARPDTIPTAVPTPRPTPVGLPPLPAAAAQIVTLNLLANDLAYDPISQRMYASVPGLGGSIGNTVTAVDPVAGSIGASIPVGSEPGQMAISEDGQYLYVGLNGAGAMRRVHLPSRSADLQFSLSQPADPQTTAGSYGTAQAWQVVVPPGSPHTVVVARDCGCGSSPHGMGVAVFDDGVMRPKLGRGNSIALDRTGSTVYGYTNEDTGYGFTRMALDGSGLTQVDSSGGVIDGFYVRIEGENGLVYASTGKVVDPESRTVVGTYPGTDDPNAHRFGRLQSTTIVRPDASVNRTFFLIGNRTERETAPTTMQLLVFDQRNFTLVGTLEVPGVSGRVRSLIRWGGDGLALNTSAGQLFILRSRLVAGT